MIIRRLDIDLVRYVAHSLAARSMSGDEPIPPFETRYPDILESCVNTPFQKFDRKNLYKNLQSQAAILFYLLIKNHPFQNGNKRIAVTTLLVFLSLNKKWLRVDTKELYNFAVWVAQSPPKLKKSVLEAIEDFININLVKF